MCSAPSLLGVILTPRHNTPKCTKAVVPSVLAVCVPYYVWYSLKVHNTTPRLQAYYNVFMCTVAVHAMHTTLHCSAARTCGSLGITTDMLADYN